MRDREVIYIFYSCYQSRALDEGIECSAVVVVVAYVGRGRVWPNVWTCYAEQLVVVLHRRNLQTGIRVAS